MEPSEAFRNMGERPSIQSYLSGKKPTAENRRFSKGMGVLHSIGVKGRKTGVKVKEVIARDADDLENIDDFFASSDEELMKLGPSKSPISPPEPSKSKAKIQTPPETPPFTQYSGNDELSGPELEFEAPDQDDLVSDIPEGKQEEMEPSIQSPKSLTPSPEPVRAKSPAKSSRKSPGKATKNSPKTSDTATAPSHSPKKVASPKKSSKKQTSKSKKTSGKAVSKKADATKKTGKGEEIEKVETPSVEETEVRRSSRKKVAPLQFWKNEKIVYKIDEEDGIPTIDAISKPISPVPIHRAPTHKEPKSQDVAQLPIDSPGKKRKFECIAKQKEVVTDAEKVTVTEAFKTTQFSSGVILVPSQASKSHTTSKTMVFYVQSGKLQISVDEVKFVLNPGGHFYVPGGHKYSISNPNKTICKLVYFKTS